MNCSAKLETPFSQLSMNLNINRSAFRICPPLDLVFKIGHLLGGQQGFTGRNILRLIRINH